jgi:hypothetical protein
MSTNYKSGNDVPNEVLSSRLYELSKAVTEGKDAVSREFTMRVPAELDRDADLVLYEASRRIKEFDSERVNHESGKALMKEISDINHDLCVSMQAAYIEWKHGKGADEAMSWIEATLDGPGLIPEETEPYGTEAQAYYDSNKAHPFPICECGRPSNIAWMGKGFCCDEHYEKARSETSAANVQIKV